jgi:four helix bundle protein
MYDFRKLKVWGKAHDLTLEVYKETVMFPPEEKYGLTSQLRRACSSIPTNICEGCGRNSRGDFDRFLEIAMGSASETEYLLLLSHDLGYLVDDCYKRNSGKITEIKRMLSSLAKTVQSSRR